MKSKELLRHELLNICTIGTVLLEDGLSSDDQVRLRELLQFAGFLIAHEEVLLGKEPKFLRQKIFLKEFLEILLSSSEFPKKISIEGVGHDTVFFGDRYYLEESFRRIFDKLSSCADFLKISFSEPGQILKIFYRLSSSEEIAQKPLRDVFEKDFLSPDQTPYQFGLHILERHGCRPEISSQEMKIFLNSN